MSDEIVHASRYRDGWRRRAIRITALAIAISLAAISVVTYLYPCGWVHDGFAESGHYVVSTALGRFEVAFIDGFTSLLREGFFRFNDDPDYSYYQKRNLLVDVRFEVFPEGWIIRVPYLYGFVPAAIFYLLTFWRRPRDIAERPSPVYGYDLQAIPVRPPECGKNLSDPDPTQRRKE